MLHWGSVLLKQLYNLDLQFTENWPKRGRTIKRPCLGTIIKALLGISYSEILKTFAYKNNRVINTFKNLPQLINFQMKTLHICANCETATQ